MPATRRPSSYQEQRRSQNVPMSSSQASKKGEGSRLLENQGVQEQGKYVELDLEEEELSEAAKEWVKVNFPERPKHNFCKDPESFSTGQLVGETTEEHFARYSREQSGGLGVPLDPSYSVPRGLSQQVLDSHKAGVVYLKVAGITASQSQGRVILPGTDGPIDMGEISPKTVSDFGSSYS